MAATQKPVLVTGVTGFIGAEITQQLLSAGYNVRGTTRDVGKALSQGHITSLSGAEDRLELVEADLLSPGAFDRAAQGCDYVMHVASPYSVNVSDPERDLVDPAVGGTLALLEAASASGSVRRVVLTSSFAAIIGWPPRHVFTEADWNTQASLDFGAYYFSKAVAERAAWDYMEAEPRRFDLVVINPVWVIGPSLVPTVNESHLLFVGATNGSQPAIIAIDHPFVDVRDVARAHIKAMESPAAQGRYITAAANTSHRKIVDVARTLGFGERYRLPRLNLTGPMGVRVARLASRFQPKGTRDFLEIALGNTFHVDTTKIETELSITFRDLEETIVDTWRDLERWGHLGKPSKARL